MPGSAAAETGEAPPPEADVSQKADYLFKLAAFVRWPDAAAGDFRICTSGRADIAAELAALVRDQQVGGRKVAITQLTAAQAEEAPGCAILFLGRNAETAQAMLKAVEGKAVLTVTDRGGGTRGGVIEFVPDGDKVRLAVDRSEAGTQKLELSSKLMDVAAEVKQ